MSSATNLGSAPSTSDDPRLWSQPMTIAPEWIDYNGHLNMAYYNVMFDRGADDTFSVFGVGPDYLASRGMTTFTAEAHVTYLREVAPDETIRVATRMLDFDEKRFHFFQEMYAEGDDRVRATSENISLHVLHAESRVVPMPDDIQDRLRAVWKSHLSLPNAPQVGHVIGIRRKR
ncbi:MAG: thioesterase family protein [Pseudomonadota bacterium]